MGFLDGLKRFYWIPSSAIKSLLVVSPERSQVWRSGFKINASTRHCDSCASVGQGQRRANEASCLVRHGQEHSQRYHGQGSLEFPLKTDFDNLTEVVGRHPFTQCRYGDFSCQNHRRWNCNKRAISTSKQNQSSTDHQFVYL